MNYVLEVFLKNVRIITVVLQFSSKFYRLNADK